MCKDEKLHQELSTLASLFTVYYVRSPQARAIEMILWKLGLKINSGRDNREDRSRLG